MKRFILLLSLAAMLMALTAPCFALEPGALTEVRKGDMAMPKMQNGLQELSEQDMIRCQMDRQEMLRKQAKLSVLETTDNSAVKPNSVVDGGLDLTSVIFTQLRSAYPFVYFKQEASNTCSVACARMCLKAIAGINVTEATAAKAMGVNSGNSVGMTKVVDYINSKQSKKKYYVSGSTSSQVFHADIVHSITWGAPAVVGIYDKKGQYWKFPVQSKHGIVAYGVTKNMAYNNNQGTYYIADPWGGYIGMSEWCEFSRTSGQLYNVYKNSGAGYATGL